MEHRFDRIKYEPCNLAANFGSKVWRQPERLQFFLKIFGWQQAYQRCRTEPKYVVMIICDVILGADFIYKIAGFWLGNIILQLLGQLFIYFPELVCCVGDWHRFLKG